MTPSHSIRPLIDWLDYNGFTVKTRPVKEHDDGEGRRKIKRSIGVDLAVDALEIARHVNHIFLLQVTEIFDGLLKVSNDQASG